MLHCFQTQKQPIALSHNILNNAHCFTKKYLSKYNKHHMIIHVTTCNVILNAAEKGAAIFQKMKYQNTNNDYLVFGINYKTFCILYIILIGIIRYCLKITFFYIIVKTIVIPRRLLDTSSSFFIPFLGS